MTKIAVSGASGKMGQAVIAESDLSSQITLAETLDKGEDLHAILTKFDVLIDFSSPASTMIYLDICSQAGKKMVIGTTGFDDNQLTKIHQFAKKIPIVFAPNMSIGVNLSLKLIKMAAKIIGDDSDIEIIEAHHRDKVDSPSGTALKMGEVAANALSRDLKDCAIYTRHGQDKKRSQQSIGFSTIRGGDVVGEHRICFFMAGEQVEITHKASSRSIFAKGAVLAASWLKNQPAGLYSMQNVLDL